MYGVSLSSVCDEVADNGYSRSISELISAARIVGLGVTGKTSKLSRKLDRRYPELLTPGEIVQIDVKEVPVCPHILSA